MENRVLRNFLAVAKEGNITVASEKVHISQSTLSRQMKDLEEELGHTLFTREPHCVRLTKSGEVLVERASTILDVVDDTLAHFRSLSESISGDIWVGLPELYSLKEVFSEISGFQREYPNVVLHVYSGGSEGVTRRLTQGILDFAFLVTPRNETDFHYIPTQIHEKWGLIMPKDAPEAAFDAITPEMMRRVPLIISRQTLKATGQDLVQDWVGCSLKELDIKATINLAYNSTFLIRKGMGYVLAFDDLVDYKDDLCFRPLSPEFYTSVDFVWRKNKKFSPVAQLLFDRLKDYFTNRPE